MSWRTQSSRRQTKGQLFGVNPHLVQTGMFTLSGIHTLLRMDDYFTGKVSHSAAANEKEMFTLFLTTNMFANAGFCYAHFLNPTQEGHIASMASWILWTAMHMTNFFFGNHLDTIGIDRFRLVIWAVIGPLFIYWHFNDSKLIHPKMFKNFSSLHVFHFALWLINVGQFAGSPEGTQNFYWPNWKNHSDVGKVFFGEMLRMMGMFWMNFALHSVVFTNNTTKEQNACLGYVWGFYAALFTYFLFARRELLDNMGVDMKFWYGWLFTQAAFVFLFNEVKPTLSKSPKST